MRHPGGRSALSVPVQAVHAELSHESIDCCDQPILRFVT